MNTIRIRHNVTSGGIAIGHAHILATSGSIHPKYWIADKEVDSEIRRLKKAIQKSEQQLAKVKDKLCRFEGAEQINIIDSHTMLLQDEMVVTHAIETIRNQNINAEWALDKVISSLKMVFTDSRDEYFKQKKYDIDYISQRIIKNLMGSAELSLHGLKKENIILIAGDLSPADVATLNRKRVKGFITALGGPTSHTAIIARSLEIPAVVGIENITGQVHEDDVVVIDGIKNMIVINPPKDDLKSYKKRHVVYEETKFKLLADVRKPARTKDGVNVNIVSNIELLEEIEPALHHGAEGVGLFRTEYLYLNRMDLPSEEEQFEYYKSVLEQMAPHPVTIRTLDIDGDKLLMEGDYADHLNPALGLRAIRFCLAEPEIFETQLRALLRANAYGNLRILIPMISDINEIRSVKKIIANIQAKLKKSKIKFNKHVQLGIMIETPSAAITADSLAKEVDFFSIGTNDLIQYLIAVDRTNEHVSYLYNPLHPAVIAMIKKTVDAAKARKIEVTLCGEMAGDPLYLLLLLGAGLDGLSMNPVSIPRVKRLLREITMKEARELFDKVSRYSTTAEIEKTVKTKMNKYLETSKRSKSAKPHNP